jgi:hypothetical protein
VIYFITAREIGRVKIGLSDEPRGRFIKMRSDSPTALALERLCEGDTTAERELHVRFAEHRLHGEWFALSPEIEAHMAALPAYTFKRERKGLPGKLGSWIIDNGHTLETFARAAGVTGATISRTCAGKQNVRLATAERIIAATNHEVTLSDLSEQRRRA